jgi:hypothetical protein
VSAGKSKASSYRASLDPGRERRQHARTEDVETEAMIRRYMRLADDMLQSNQADSEKPGERLNRFFELAEFCIGRDWPKAS